MKNKIFFVSLGCDKNLVDAEHMLFSLRKNGYEITDEPEEAEVIIINSCCFIADAMEESINSIIELARYKDEGKLKSLIVTGCLAERFSDQIKKELPEVDGIIGTASFDKIIEVVERSLNNEFSNICLPLDRLPETEGRLLTTGGHYAYLKIAEGCNKNCSYCIIPKVRGPYRSFPMEDIIKEASDLVDNGVREIILVAQETTLYGTDIYGKKALPELLRKLSSIKSLAWIRLLYAYPEEINEELIDELANNPKICHYIDMPIQHCNDNILRRMGRRTNKAELIQKIKTLRSRIPDICLRTTLITGFPGETEDEHNEMLDFIKEIRFDRLGAFPYSKEDGTPAAEFEDQTDDLTKNIRYDNIMRAQQIVAFARNEETVGKELDIFIEGQLPEDNVYVGRTYKDAPGVDGLVFVTCPYPLMSGDFVTAKVTATKDYDLLGEVLNEDESTQ